MDPEKVNAVANWPVPRNVKDVQAFLRFTNFYRRFLRGFSTIAKALIVLTEEGGHKEFPLTTDSAAMEAFHKLRGRQTNLQNIFRNFKIASDKAYYGRKQSKPTLPMSAETLLQPSK